MSLFGRFAIPLLIVLPVACGSSPHRRTASGTDAGTDAPVDAPSADAPPVESGAYDAAPETSDAFAPAPHDPAPQVLSAGGPVLEHPRVVPVFFQNDPGQTGIEQFLSALAQSSYWGAATSEYGVGKLTIAPSIVTSSTPPASYYAVDQFVSQIAAQYGAGDAGSAGAAGASGDGGLLDGAAGASGDGGLLDGAAGAPGDGGLLDGAAGAPGDGGGDAGTPQTADIVYAVFLPLGVSISLPGYGVSCVDYGGYHTETYAVSPGSGVAYALIPRCQPFGSGTDGDALTATLSHELIEAATDPYANSNPAYSYVDDAHAVWNIVPLGEIGDMCAFEPQSFASLFGNYTVQRVWSNLASAAGHDPCVPNTTQAYFNSVPDQPDDLLLKQQFGFSTQTRGVKLAVGQTRTIDVHLFSDAPRGGWTVDAEDAAPYVGGSPTLSLDLNPQYGKNGDVLKLTITRLAASPMGVSEFMLWSEDPQTLDATVWFGYVGD